MERANQLKTESDALKSQNTIELQKRANEFEKRLEAVKSKLNTAEYKNQSLEREFMEEVNLKVIALHPYRVFTYISDKGNRHTVELVYFVQLEVENKNISYKFIKK